MAGEVIRVALLTWLTERHKEDLTYTRAASRFPFDAAAASAAALTMASRKCLFFLLRRTRPAHCSLLLSGYTRRAEHERKYWKRSSGRVRRADCERRHPERPLPNHSGADTLPEQHSHPSPSRHFGEISFFFPPSLSFSVSKFSLLLRAVLCSTNCQKQKSRRSFFTIHRAIRWLAYRLSTAYRWTC